MRCARIAIHRVVVAFSEGPELRVRNHLQESRQGRREGVEVLSRVRTPFSVLVLGTGPYFCLTQLKTASKHAVEPRSRANHDLL